MAGVVGPSLRSSSPGGELLPTTCVGARSAGSPRRQRSGQLPPRRAGPHRDVIRPPEHKFLAVAGVAVVATALLSAKPALNPFVRRLSRQDMVATLSSSSLAVVILRSCPTARSGPSKRSPAAIGASRGDGRGGTPGQPLGSIAIEGLREGRLELSTPDSGRRSVCLALRSGAARVEGGQIGWAPGARTPRQRWRHGGRGHDHPLPGAARAWLASSARCRAQHLRRGGSNTAVRRSWRKAGRLGLRRRVASAFASSSPLEQ